jgi:hypothetical protein
MIGLLELLNIQSKALPRDTRDATAFLCEEWERQGRPADTRGLEEFLDAGLDECMSRELWFAKIFLRCLGELRRRQWSPDWVKMMKAKGDE